MVKQEGDFLNSKKMTPEERKKNHIIDHLMSLGIYKVHEKHLYQVPLEDLMKEYKKHTS